MRILQLDLTAYGSLTDVSLDFDRSEAGLAIILGVNEAGKSTTRQAIDHLLFGIPNSSFAFIHGYDQLQIAGRIRNDDGEEIEIVRRKGKKGSLREAKSQRVLDEDALVPFLGSIDRTRFLSIFGLDHDRLLAGGREVLAGKGDLGQLLFASGAGLVGLHELQGKLQEESKAIYSERARNPKLNSALAEVARLRTEISKLQTESARWIEWDASLHQTRDEVTQLKSQVSEALKRVRHHERLLEAMPLWTRRKVWMASLHNLRNPRRLADDFESRYRDSLSKFEVAIKQREIILEQWTILTRSLEDVSKNDSLLNAPEAIDSLRSKQASVAKAAVDRSAIREQVRRLAEEIEKQWHSLRGSAATGDVDQRPLTIPIQAKLKALLREHVNRRESLSRAEEDARKRREDLTHIESRLEQFTLEDDSSSLQDVLDELQRVGDLDKQTLDHERERSLLLRQQEMEFQSLEVSATSGRSLVSARMPEIATIEEFEDRRRRYLRELEDISSKLRELAEERESLLALVERGPLATLPTEESLEQARILRSETWRLIKGKYILGDSSPDSEFQNQPIPENDDLPSAFETRVDEADRIVDQLRSHSDDVARRAESRARLQAIERRADRLREEKDRWSMESKRWEQEWRAIWKGLVDEPGPPSVMKRWRANVESIQQTARRLLIIDAEIIAIASQRDSLLNLAKSRLGEAFPNLLSGSLAELSSSLRRIVVERETTRQRKLDLAERVRGLRIDAQSAASRVEEEIERMQEWKREWHDAMSSSGFEASLSVDEVSAILEELNSIQLKTQQKEMLEERIADMDRDEAEFEASLANFLQSRSPQLLDRPSSESLPALIKMQQAQRDNATKRAECSRQIEEWMDRRSRIDLAIAEAEAELIALCKEAECNSPSELPRALEESREARRIEDIRKKIDETDAQLMPLASGENADNFIKELEEGSLDRWQACVDEDRKSIASWNERIEEAQRRVGSLETQLRTLDGNAKAAARAEDLQAALDVVRRESRRYMILRLASDVLSEAMESYRKDNEDPILHRASEFFRRLTLGSFEGLRIDFDATTQKPILTGYRVPEGPSLFVESMSEGTVDQLFLALRLASLEGYLAHHESMPFVVDDILVNFDDDRAAAALDILADLSKRTQVLFFTHHQRLVEIAQERLDPKQFMVRSLPCRMLAPHQNRADAHVP